MHAYRRRGRLILFDDVDVNTQIEAAVGGQGMVKPLLIRSANHKSVEQLSSEIRTSQHQDPPSERRYRAALAFLSLPRPVRTLAWRFLLGIPNGSSASEAPSEAALSGCSARQVAGVSRSPRPP